MAKFEAKSSNEREPLYIRLLEEYRVPLLALCLPLSFLYGIYINSIRLAKALFGLLFSTPSTHKSRVERIKAILVANSKLPAGKRKILTTDRANTDSLTLGFYNKKGKCLLPTSALRHILSLDAKKRTVTVEPMVSVQQAADYLIPRGFILASHLEYGRATLGGLAMAVGMTTHAHKTGLLQETVVAYDVLLATGEELHVTAEGPHADLFHALPWSHGTLCTVVSITLQVIPIKKYVRLQYIPVTGLDNIGQAIRQHSGALDPARNAEAPTFMEATLFSVDKAVLTLGTFDDGTDGDVPVNPLARWYKPWWYKHVESYSKRDVAGVELVPVKDYLLRHTRAIFWVIEIMVPYGNHWLFRLLFGWLLPLDPTFMKLTTTSGVRKLTYQKQVFQDITLPMTELESSIRIATECWDLWPLLVYPCKEFDKGELSKNCGHGQLRPPRPDQKCPGQDWGMFFDLGIYGVPGYILRKEPFNPTKSMRRFVEHVIKVGGHPFLYADQFYSEEEFEGLFDLRLWRICREKYSAQGQFPSLWDKVKPEVDIIAGGDVVLFPAHANGEMKKTK